MIAAAASTWHAQLELQFARRAGIAGGDSLTLSASLLDGAHALMLTPGATKWYRGGGRNARQQLRFSVQGTAILDGVVSDDAAVRTPYSNFAPALAILSAQHETQYSRLFKP